MLVAEEAAGVPDVDIEATDHPVFQELVQGQNPLVRTMHVERFLRPARGLVTRCGSGRADPGAVAKPRAAGRREELWPGARDRVPDDVCSLLE